MENPVFLPKIIDAKSELVLDADISKAVHSEGGWYLIPTEYCYMYVHTTVGNCLDSLVFHVCCKSWLVKDKSTIKKSAEATTTPYTSHRTTLHDMQNCCVYCEEPVPESVVALWTLHNWDLLSLNEHPA